MRSRNEIQSIILYIQTIKKGEYILKKIKIKSWVAIYPRKKGGHAKYLRKYAITTIAGSYKIKVLEYQLKGAFVYAVKVIHAYMHQQLQLNPATPTLQAACNYLYPTIHEEWIDPLSIMKPICVVHAKIREATRGDQNH